MKEKWGILGFSFGRRSALMLPLVFLFLFTMLVAISFRPDQQFSYLAQSFLHLKLYFLHPIGGVGSDPVYFNNHIYWSEGILPAVLLMPCVAIAQAFHVFFYQGYLSWLLSGGVLYFVYKLARKLNYDRDDSLLFGLTFAIGSVFIGVSAISSSWYYEQVVTTFLLFWSLYEFFGRDNIRWWLLGLLSGLIVLTRPTAAAVFVLFACEFIYLYKSSFKEHLLLFIKLCAPVVIAGGVMALYNYLRFHSPIEGGFKYELLSPVSVNSRNLGQFSPIHMPANLYSLLLRAPLPVLRGTIGWTLKFPYIQNNSLGMSIFITSPYLIFLFTRKWKDYTRQHRFTLLAVLLSLVAVTCYFGIGLNQYGYRYSLDFLPLLFYLFMALYRKEHAKIGIGMKTLLIGAIFLNFYLLMTFIY